MYSGTVVLGTDVQWDCCTRYTHTVHGSVVLHRYIRTVGLFY